MKDALYQLGGYGRGMVTYYSDEKGFGFIRPTDGSPDLFFHFNAHQIPGMTGGDRVGFPATRDERARTRMRAGASQLGLQTPAMGAWTVFQIAAPRVSGEKRQAMPWCYEVEWDAVSHELAKLGTLYRVDYRIWLDVKESNSFDMMETVNVFGWDDGGSLAELKRAFPLTPTGDPLRFNVTDPRIRVDVVMYRKQPAGEWEPLDFDPRAIGEFSKVENGLPTATKANEISAFAAGEQNIR